MSFLKQKEIKMIWYEAFGYSLFYAYVAFGVGHFLAKIRDKVRDNTAKQETVKKE